MTPSKKQVVQLLEAKIDEILQAPLSCGNLNAVEHLFYHLTECWLFSLLGTDSHAFKDYYDMFVTKNFGVQDWSITGYMDSFFPQESELEKARRVVKYLANFKQATYEKELKYYNERNRVVRKEERDSVLIEPNPKKHTPKVIVK